jgi:hypothetical protein
MKIKQLCNDIELENILNNIKDDYINNDNFYILYDYKSYDRIYTILDKSSLRNSNLIIYCDTLKENIPEKICIILKKNIEEILDSGNSNFYNTIDFLKIYKTIVSNEDFINYTTGLVKKHSKKSKFKKLFNEFIF